MEDKIEVGEYVRTKNGYIRKVVKEFDKENNCYIVDKPYYNEKISEILKGIILEEDIVKHSKNIINLVKTGDYVNGMLVVNVITVNEYNVSYVVVVCNREEKCILKPITIYEHDVKSIVSKEQFESIKYEVENE